MVIGPIAVVYNVDGVTACSSTPPTLAKIFAGKITKWNDPAIAAQNTGAKLPATAIQTVHRSDESGTTDNFTKYLSKTAAADWTFDHAKAWKAPGGTGAKGSDGVAAKVKSTPGTIAYVELSFAENSDLKMAKIKNGAGEYTELTGDSAGKTIEGAKITGTGNDLNMDIDYATTHAGCVPDRPGDLRDRLQQGQRQGRRHQGLPDLHLEHRRPVGAQRPRLRPAARVGPHQGRRLGRRHLLSHSPTESLRDDSERADG